MTPMQSITSITAALALLLAACEQATAPGPAETAAPAPEEESAAGLVDPAAIDAALEGYIERGELVGVSALVYEDGREAYFGAFGMADREAGRPMSRDSVVRIFSMTKPLTGVTLMTFFEEGRFGLDDPLEKYLPEYADVQVYVRGEGDEVVLEPPARPILVHDILRHTAGFGGTAFVDQELDEQQSLEHTLAELSQKLASVPLGYQPGTRWLYGPSVDVQARLVEVLAGKPYAEVLGERVLEPLGMHDTHYVLEDAQQDRFVELYERRPDGSFERAAARALADFNLQPSPLTPGGWGLVSTLDDYMRFARMLLGGGELDGVRILETETVELMATDSLPDSVADRSWLPNKGQVGFGIDFAVRVAPPANDAEASGAVGEYFWDGLANTLFWVDPENDITAVLFNQYIPWGQTEIQKDFRDAIYRNNPAASALSKPAAGPDTPRLSD
jgi:CubicO group peptidase (beta-lactamase class C family)